MFSDESVKRFDWCYALLQMQYSLRLLYEYENDGKYKTRYAKLMQKIASYMPIYTEKTKKFIDNIQYRGPIMDWRKVHAKFMWDICSYGKSVYIPILEVSDSLQQTVRNHAEAMVIYALTPDIEVPTEEITFFGKLIQALDFKKAVAYWPLLCADAWWVLRKRLKK